MRGMGGIATVRARGVKVLAWLSLLIAALGGALVADTWIGDLLVTLLRLPPLPWLPGLLLVVIVVGGVIDLFVDGEPNQMAVAAVMLAPTVATATQGRLSVTVGRLSGSLLHSTSGWLAGWTGATSRFGLAITCIVAAVLMARRVVRKSPGV